MSRLYFAVNGSLMTVDFGPVSRSRLRRSDAEASSPCEPPPTQGDTPPPETHRAADARDREATRLLNSWSRRIGKDPGFGQASTFRKRASLRTLAAIHESTLNP